MASVTFAQEAEDRKARSIAILTEQNIPVLDWLPLSPTEETSLRRSEEEVIQRLLALVVVAVKGETEDSALAFDIIAQYGVAGYFSPEELAFIDARTWDQQTRVDMTWRYEGVAVLLWSLGLFDPGAPDQIVNVRDMVAVIRELGPEGLRARAKLRPQAELLDALDLIYRSHWATTQARVDGVAPPDGLHPGVVFERHFAFNWLIGLADVPWDETPTDT